MTSQAQIDWTQIGQVWGPLGVLAVLFLLFVVAGAKWLKGFVEGTLADARRDRDAARTLNETQANKFLESMARRDEVMEKGFDEILRELRSSPRRK